MADEHDIIGSASEFIKGKHVSKKRRLIYMYQFNIAKIHKSGVLSNRMIIIIVESGVESLTGVSIGIWD